MADSTVQILLVDDDNVSALLVERAFQRRHIANPMHRARDGVEALQMLRGGDGKPPLARPFLVLLDLQMPRMNGHEFLAELRADQELQDAIVFVLTTSADQRDVAEAYARNVAGYIVKQRAGDDFVHLIETLNCYWRVVEFPPGRNIA